MAPRAAIKAKRLLHRSAGSTWSLALPRNPCAKKVAVSGGSIYDDRRSRLNFLRWCGDGAASRPSATRQIRSPTILLPNVQILRVMEYWQRYLLFTSWRQLCLGPVTPPNEGSMVGRASTVGVGEDHKVSSGLSGTQAPGERSGTPRLTAIAGSGEAAEDDLERQGREQRRCWAVRMVSIDTLSGRWRPPLRCKFAQNFTMYGIKSYVIYGEFTLHSTKPRSPFTCCCATLVARRF